MGKIPILTNIFSKELKPPTRLGKLPVVVTSGILARNQRRRVSIKASELWINLLQHSAEKLEDICEDWKKLDVNATKFQIDQLLGSIALDSSFFYPKIISH